MSLVMLVAQALSTALGTGNALTKVIGVGGYIFDNTVQVVLDVGDILLLLFQTDRPMRIISVIEVLVGQFFDEGRQFFARLLQHLGNFIFNQYHCLHGASATEMVQNIDNQFVMMKSTIVGW